MLYLIEEEREGIEGIYETTVFLKEGEPPSFEEFKELPGEYVFPTEAWSHNGSVGVYRLKQLIGENSYRAVDWIQIALGTDLPYFVGLLLKRVPLNPRLMSIPSSVVSRLIGFNVRHNIRGNHTEEEFRDVIRREIGNSSLNGFENYEWHFKDGGTEVKVSCMTNFDYPARMGRDKWILKLRWEYDGKKYEALITPWYFHSREL